MPENGTVAPLPLRCRQENHDIKSSFLHIDNHRDRTVWLAFSSDAWSPEVLKGYQNGDRSDSRFTKLTVSKDGKVTANGALVIDYSLSSLTQNVAEYATELFPNTAKVDGSVTGGAHGFHSRKNPEKLKWLSSYINRLGEEYRCPVMAVPVDDPVGIVQELKAGQLNLVEARQTYIAQPGVAHQQMVSRAITREMERIQAHITNNSKPLFERSSSGYPMAMKQTRSKEQMAQDAISRQFERLQKSYDEPARPAFEQQDESWMKGFQERIEAIGKDLAVWYQAELWRAIINHDYATENSPLSWLCPFSTITTCLQGGATDAHTQKVWLAWLNEADSPVWKGFTGAQPSAMAQILGTPPFSTTGGYSYLKTLAGSDEMAHLMEYPKMQVLWASRITAVSGSVAKLAKQMNGAVHDLYGQMLQAGLHTATGKKVTLFRFTSTVGELQNIIRRQSQMMFSATGKASVLSGVAGNLSTSAVGHVLGFSSAEDLARVITINMTTEKTPEMLTALRSKAGVSLAQLARAPLSNPALLRHFPEAELSHISLHNNAGKVVGTLSDATIDEILEEKTRRFTGGHGVGIVLSAFMLAFQLRDWQNNYQSLQKAIGDDRSEKMAVLSNGLMVMSAASEIAGFGRMMSIKNNWLILPKDYVHPLVRFGGILAGVASVVDGVRLYTQGNEANKAGDKAAADDYHLAAYFTAAGGFLSGWAGYTGTAALLGPAGIAILLIVTGALLALEADGERSTPFEVWLRRCCFGKPRNSDVVWHATSNDDMNSCLAAFNAVLNGMVAEVGFTGLSESRSGDHDTKLEMRLLLPACSELDSAWQFRLTARRADGQDTMMVSEMHNVDGQINVRPTGGQFHDGGYKRMTVANGMEIRVLMWVSKTRYTGATLTATYWPNKMDLNSQLGLTTETD